MKTSTLLLCVAGCLLLQRSSAQPCTLGNPGVKLNYTVTQGSNCQIGLDLYFDMIHNPGGKWLWVHIWPTASYSNWNYNNPPTTSNGGLTGSIATFGLEHQGTSLVIQASYPPDAAAPGFQYSGLIAVEGPGSMTGSERYTIKNLVLTVPGGCNTPQSFTADVWESQSAQSQNVHCFVKGMNFYANDPSADGLLLCSNPRRYRFTITTINSGGMNVNFKVFVDDGDGIFNKITDTLQVNNGSVALDALNGYKYQSPLLDYLPWSGQQPYADKDLWLEVTSPAVPNAIYAQLLNSCIPLAVKFTSFTAVRAKELVRLQWRTATEAGNSGFYIERKNSSAGWQTVTFVPTQAPGGNSNTELYYSFDDYNIVPTITEYRLRQTDQDGKNAYSEIKPVKGLNQPASLQVYPNPTPDGQITVVTSLTGELVLRLIDMNGKIVRQWSDFANGRIFIGALAAGTYSLQVYSKATLEMQQTKIILAR